MPELLLKDGVATVTCKSLFNNKCKPVVYTFWKENGYYHGKEVHGNGTDEYISTVCGHVVGHFINWMPRTSSLVADYLRTVDNVANQFNLPTVDH